MPEIGPLVEVAPGIRWTLSPIAPQSRLRAELGLRFVLDTSDQ